MAESRTKTLYLNGLIVGEVPTTGDYEGDLQAMQSFLKERGLDKGAPTLVQAMFRQAVSFATVAASLHKSDLARAPRNPLAIAPFVVNSALAMELYLKTLNQLNNVTLKTHVLSELYDALPPSTRQLIWSEAQEHAPSFKVVITNESDIPEWIRSFDKTFVEWRYVYEKERSGLVKIGPMIVLLNAFHDGYRKLSAT